MLGICSALHGISYQLLDMKKIAIFRPRWARNNTAFETQARMYHYLQTHYNLTVTIFADKENHFSYDGLEVIEIENKVKKGVWRKIRKMFGYALYNYTQVHLLENYDVIESSDPTLYEWTYTALTAAQRYGAHLTCGSSVTNVDDVVINLNRAQEAISFSDNIWCCTVKAKERFEKLGLIKSDDQRVCILGHALDTDLFRPIKKKLANGRINLLSVGHINTNKGHQIILPVISKLISEGINIEWDIIGYGDKEKELKQDIASLRLDAYVNFLGVIPNSSLPAYYANSDIFILHQLYQETFGLSLAESMACGTPVIASTVGGITTLVIDKKTGLLVEPNDTTNLKSSLRKLCIDKRMREKMGKAARAHILENYSLKTVAQRSLHAWGLENMI